jgi:hypothetical protein
MSAFDDWEKSERMDGETVYDKWSMEQAFNAGMAHAMDIVVEPIMLTAGNERKNLILAQAAATIQKEIE